MIVSVCPEHHRSMCFMPSFLSKVEILCHDYLKFKKVGILLQPRPHPECLNHHEAGQIAVPLIS